MAKKKPAPQTIGQRIRSLRIRAGLSVPDAAASAGIGKTYWHNLEGGRRSPGWETFASALRASLGDFDPERHP